jgi:lipopolysaccharide transport system ATP-binding protein
MKPILEIQSVSKKFRIRHESNSYLSLRESITGIFKKNSVTSEDFFALDNVSFTVNPGESIGIIGKNGAGKSTLLKILSRITPPSSGKVTVRGRIASLLEVGTGFHPELSGRENIFLNGSILGMKRKEIISKFDEIVDFSGTQQFLDTPLKHFSSGMQLRLAFSVAAFLEPEILVIDEVLAVGDAEFQKKCIGKMEDVHNSGRTILFVSHNIGALQNLCKKGIVLKNGKVDFSGDIMSATEHYSSFLALHQGTSAPHVIYSAPEKNNKPDPHFCHIKEISLHDKNGNPKPVVSTWDEVVFRISYESEKEVERGGIDLLIKTFDGSKILKLSTQPDSTLPLRIKKGIGTVECHFAKLPLAAGSYLIGAGLARPNTEWLNWQDDLCSFHVSPSDVYKSGLAPHTERSFIATEHSWKEL